ncbi:MAG: nucleotidyltransferase domain-containing protein [Candidatus Hodarchaeaceae archaeon]|nr:nucleotidyltransferase domain-containing protein [Candidatus Hodarchaeaceae archaeon]
MPICRFCSSREVVRAGIHYAGKSRKQRLLCKGCGRVFIAPFPTGLDIKKLASALRERGVKKAWLFGSYARGEARPGSDVDILVEFPKPVGLELFRIQRELSEVLGMKVELGTKLDPHIEREARREMKAIL